MDRTKCFRQVISGLFIAIAFTGSLVASNESMLNEAKTSNSDVEHVKVGDDRQMSLAQFAAHQEVRAEKAKALSVNETESDECDSIPSDSMLLASASIRAQMPESDVENSVKKEPFGSKLYTTHPGVFYKPNTVSVFGDTVEFHDGSIWSIAFDDRPFVFNWFTSDDVVIMPNDDWYSLYTYRLHNQQTGLSVRSNIYLGPVFRGFYSYWIIAIDYYNDQVCLQDGSIWSMSPLDDGITRNWKIGDTVILGVNNNSFSSIRPNILINVNMNNYGMGNCLFY